LTARARLLLIVCFFFSGATGLVYEVVWSRYLQLVFGSTTDSIAAVLCIYMAGLGIGAAWLGRFVDRWANPARLYALLEIGVGGFALASPVLFRAVTATYAALQGWLDLPPGPATGLKVLLSAVALGVPTLLMGGTLPALRAALGAQGGRSIGRLYAANTVGAAAGSALAGYVLIEALGLWRTLVCTAAANLAIAALALWIARAASRQVAAPAARRWTTSPTAFYLGAGILLSGALAMLYEIVWTRLLTLVLGPSTYAFSTVLVVFLVGIGVGSAVQARTTHRVRGAAAFATTQLLSASAVALLLLAFEALPALTLYARLLPQLDGPRFLYAQVAFAGILFLPPALLAGYALPLCIASLADDESRAGTDVGDLYLVNTGGAILGSLVTGFALVPLLGTEGTLRLGIGIGALFGACGLFFARGWARAAFPLCGAAVLGFALLAPPWDPNVMDAGVGWGPKPKYETRLEAARILSKSPSRLLFWEEGRNATVSVRRHRAGAHTLYVGGKPDASDAGDMPTQVFSGVLPVLAHPDARRVLVVGMGSGVTADRVLSAAEVEHVDLVEMEEAVVRAGAHFSHVNNDVVDNPRVRLLILDARSHLATTRERYDIIISEPSNPWMAGISTLFSSDYYRLAQERLTEGGLFAQWMQLYSMDAGTLRMLLATFASSFAHAQLWYLTEGDLLLLGSPEPVAFSLAAMRRMIGRSPRLRGELRSLWSAERAEDVFGHYILGDRLLREVVGPSPEVATDDDNPVEFRAARALYRRTGDHLRRLWDIKLRAADLLPPLRDGEVFEASRWLAIARGCPHRRTALAAARRAAALAADDAEVRAVLARRLLEGGRLNEAEEWLEGTGKWEASLRLSLAVARERLDEAEALLTAHPTLRRGRFAALPVEARAKRGDLEGAWAAAREAVARLRSAPRTARRKAAEELVEQITSLAQQTRRWRRAAGLLTRPGWGDAAEYARLRALAGFFDRLGDATQALAAVEKLERFGTLVPGLLEIKERSLWALGDYVAAKKVAAWLAHADHRGRRLLLADP